MKKTVNMSAAVIVLLAIAVVTMSFGFASYAQKLTITGTTTVKSSKWSVHYKTDSLTKNAGSQDPAASSQQLTDTAWTFATTLNEPGEFYDWTAKVVNDGTINAQLTKITLSTLTEAQQKYLTYEVTYTPYTCSAPDSCTPGTAKTVSATEDSLGIALSSGDYAIVNVKATYVQPDSENDLPADDANITLTAALDYVQVD